MKINKLKVFFIIMFVSLLVPLAYIPNKEVFSASKVPDVITYPPLPAPNGYDNLEYYNYCGITQGCAYLSSYKTKNTYNIISTTTSSTYITTFSCNGYRKHTKKLFDWASTAAIDYNNYLIISTQDNIYYLNQELIIVRSIGIKNCYDIKVIDNNIYYFCSGSNNIYTDSLGTFVFTNSEFVNKYGKLFVFFSHNNLIITDFSQELSFNIDSLYTIESINNNIYFVAKVQENTIVTCLNDFDILFTTIINAPAESVILNSGDNKVNLFLISDKTYLYTLCNHGDILSQEVYTQDKLISLNNQTYQKDNNIHSLINNKEYIFSKAFFDNIENIIDEHIIFLSDSFVSRKKDIYIAKLK